MLNTCCYTKCYQNKTEETQELKEKLIQKAWDDSQLGPL